MRKGSRLLAASALLAATLTGCSSSDPPAPTPPTSASGTVGTAGGQVSLPDGAAITVPAGALGSPVQAGLARDATGAPPLLAGFKALSDVYQFTPHGTASSLPVSLALPFDAGRLPPAPGRSSCSPSRVVPGPSSPAPRSSRAGWWPRASTSPTAGWCTTGSRRHASRSPSRARQPPPLAGAGAALGAAGGPAHHDHGAGPGPARRGVGPPLHCTATPDLQLERTASASAGGPWIPVATQASAGTADFQVPVDAPQSGWLHFRVLFYCTL